MQEHDERWMALALSLGRRAMGTTWPNPAVGCVIVKDGRLIGRGITAAGGRPHAETVALQMAGAAAKGAVVYVTLEPCAHTGQTPPCAQILVKAGVSRVVSAIEDPDPRVAGKGHQILRDAGIGVTTNCLADQAARDHAGFFTQTTKGRAFVTLKMATSLDGRIATQSGESQWITGAGARRMVHLMRAQHDAVLIGSGTALADDPSLTVRGLGIARNPVRVLIDSKLSLPPSATLLRDLPDAPLWICHSEAAPMAAINALKGLGARLLPVATSGGFLDLRATMKSLADQGLTRILCEGGGRLAAALMAANLVDRYVGFTAGLALGARGLPGLGTLDFDRLADHPRFELVESQNISGDVMHIWERP